MGDTVDGAKSIQPSNSRNAANESRPLVLKGHLLPTSDDGLVKTEINKRNVSREDTVEKLETEQKNYYGDFSDEVSDKLTKKIFHNIIMLFYFF